MAGKRFLLSWGQSPIPLKEWGQSPTPLKNFMFFIITTLSIALLCAGCGIFGGGKEAEEPHAEAEFAPEERAVPEAEFESEELDVEIQTVNGSLNWSKGFIQATGAGISPPDAVNEEQGRLLALRAAYADALSKLMETTSGAQVTGTTTVKNYITEDYTIQLKIDGIIKGARELHKEYDVEKKAAAVQLGIYLEDVAKAIPREDLPSGGEIKFYEWQFKKDTTLYTIVGDDKVLQESMKTSKSLEEFREKLEQMAEKSATKDEKLISAIGKLNQEIEKLGKIGRRVEDLLDHTGIVINAAGSSIKPSMYPSLYYKDGNELKLLYGKDDGRDKNKQVLAGWAKTITDAANHVRVTKNPLVINAEGVSEEQCSFVISAEDAKMIEEMDETNHVLEDCRVVIVN